MASILLYGAAIVSGIIGSILSLMYLTGFRSGRLSRRLSSSSSSPSSSSPTFINLSGGRVRYSLTGPSTGELCVLIHGFSIPSEVWIPIKNRLLSADYRVLSYDLYGRGYSDSPGNKEDLYFFIDQLSELLTALNINTPINLFGVSMGGAIALAFTSLYPDRIRRLIVCAPAGLPTNRSLMTRLPELPIIGAWLMKYIGATMIKKNFRSEFDNKEKGEELFQIIEKWFDEHEGGVRSLASTIRYFPLDNIINYIKKLKENYHGPALVLWGTKDGVCPYQNATLLCSLCPSIHLETLENAGHMFCYESPDIMINRVLPFLKQS